MDRNNESASAVNLIWGEPPKDEALCFNDTEARFEPAPDHEPTSVTEHTAFVCWSPTLAELHETLEKSGCPVCRAEKTALRGYFKWLQQEIKSALPNQWQDAVWLCRKHGADFISLADDIVTAKLTKEKKDFWLNRLKLLDASLSVKPENSILSRIPGAVRSFKRGLSSVEIMRPWWRFQRLFMASLKYVIRCIHREATVVLYRP